MATFLSARFNTKFLRFSLSSSSLISIRLIPQNPFLDSTPPFSEQKCTNPVFFTSSNFITSSPNSCRFPAFSEEKSLKFSEPDLNFVRFYSQNLSHEKPLNPNYVSLKPHSNPTQTLFDAKPRNSYLSFIRSYSTPSPKFKIPILMQGKETNFIPSSFKYYSNSTTGTPSLQDKEKKRGPNSTSCSAIPSEVSDSEKPRDPTQVHEFQHQEIVGPTVERDVSSLAEETRQVLQNLGKTAYNLSNAVALLGLVQLSCGAWISYTTRASPLTEISIQSFAAFAFPFSLAFLLRQTLKPMSFFRKMEEHGRLQILTLALQVSKSLNLFFLRARLISFTCIVGMLVGLLLATWSN